MKHGRSNEEYKEWSEENTLIEEGEYKWGVQNI